MHLFYVPKVLRVLVGFLFCAAVTLMPQMAMADCTRSTLLATPGFGSPGLTAANFIPINSMPAVPAANDVISPKATRLFFNFDYPLDPASVYNGAGNVALYQTVYDASTSTVTRYIVQGAMSLSSDGCTVSFTPDTPLVAGLSYELAASGVGGWLQQGIISGSRGYLGLVGSEPGYTFKYSYQPYYVQTEIIVPGHALMTTLRVPFTTSDLAAVRCPKTKFTCVPPAYTCPWGLTLYAGTPYGSSPSVIQSFPAVVTTPFSVGPCVAADGTVKATPSFVQIKVRDDNGGLYTSRDIPAPLRSDHSTFFKASVSIPFDNTYGNSAGHLSVFTTVTFSDGTTANSGLLIVYTCPSACSTQYISQINVTPE